MDTDGQLAINVTTSGGATLVTPSGSLTHQNCADLRKAFENAREDTCPVVILDCKAVSALDSEALELLLEWHHTFGEAGRTLRLVHLNEVCSDILVVTRLMHVFDVSRESRKAAPAGGNGAA
jgi:anti-anti-sigma factor